MNPLGPLSPSEAVAWAKARGVVLPDVYYGQLRGFARATSFSVANIAALDQLLLIKNSLDEFLERGLTLEEWQQWAQSPESPLRGFPRYRIENIFRTNIQGAFARGRCEQQRRHVEEFPYLLYDAVNDSATRPSHAAMDGFVARYDDPIWKVWRPPCGYQCRCRVIALSEKMAKQYIDTDARRQADNKPHFLFGGMTHAQARERAIKVGPDPGWDYDMCTEPDAGVVAAVARVQSEDVITDGKLAAVEDQRKSVRADLLGKGKSAKTIDDLDEAELQLLRAYSDSSALYSYPHVNKYLREGNLPQWGLMKKEQMEERAQKTISILDNTQIGEDTFLYRGTQLREFGLSKEELTVGMELTDKAIMSFSADLSVVQSDYTNKRTVVLRYRAKATDSGMKMYASGSKNSAPAAYVEDMEVALPPSSFRVTAIQKEGELLIVDVDRLV